MHLLFLKHDEYRWYPTNRFNRSLGATIAYTRDELTNVTTFWPNREEFSDFPRLLREIAAASKASPHVGLHSQGA